MQAGYSLPFLAPLLAVVGCHSAATSRDVSFSEDLGDAELRYYNEIAVLREAEDTLRRRGTYVVEDAQAGFPAFFFPLTYHSVRGVALPVRSGARAHAGSEGPADDADVGPSALPAPASTDHAAGSTAESFTFEFQERAALLAGLVGSRRSAAFDSGGRITESSHEEFLLLRAVSSTGGKVALDDGSYGATSSFEIAGGLFGVHSSPWGGNCRLFWFLRIGSSTEKPLDSPAPTPTGSGEDGGQD